MLKDKQEKISPHLCILCLFVAISFCAFLWLAVGGLDRDQA